MDDPELVLREAVEGAPLLFKVPVHPPRRHLSGKDPVYLAADGTANTIRVFHLISQTLFVETVVSAPAHDDHLDGLFARELILVERLDLGLWGGF